ncbi:protein kinase [Myxococcota bacterium]|nr:protein kinase [Myxococcota bacterium]
MTSLDEPTVRKIGRYEIIRKIATGGMAELFLARFVGPGGFEKRCALKRILPQLAVDTTFTKMFLTEARVTAMFDHPNLVQIFELGQDEAGQFYIAMELVNGLNLRQLVHMCRERGQRVPPELAAFMLVQALDGLAYAHEFRDETGQPLNLVHRDVSPQNILVSYEGAVKVVDFGIVKGSSIATETQAGMLKGKVAYMSPEQAAGDPIDARSDIFSIGVCLFELIAGEKPFTGANELMCLKAILELPPPPLSSFAPDVPEAIERIVYKALAKNRDERYSSARQLQIEIQEVLKACPTPLGRHVIAEYMRSLTEAGTSSFDATRVRLPRPSASWDRSSGAGFAAPHGTVALSGPPSTDLPLPRSATELDAFAPYTGSVPAYDAVAQGDPRFSSGAATPYDPRQTSGSAAPYDPRMHSGSAAPYDPRAHSGSATPYDPRQHSGGASALDPRRSSRPPRGTGDLSPTTGDVPRVQSLEEVYGNAGARAPRPRAPSGWTPPASSESTGLTAELAAAGIKRLNPLIFVVFAASALAGGLAVWLVTRDDQAVVVAIPTPADPASDRAALVRGSAVPDEPGARPTVGAAAARAQDGRTTDTPATEPKPGPGDAGAAIAARTTDEATAKADAKSDPKTDAKPETKAAKADASPTPGAGTKRTTTRDAKPATTRDAKSVTTRDAKPATTGTLALTSTPKGLTVILDDRTLGKTPLTGVALPPGGYTLRLVNKGLGINKKVAVRITRGEATTENVVVGKGTLKVNSRPWSEVYVDGVSKGKTPLETAVYEGSHEVRLVSPEAGGERIQRVDIQPGQTEDIRVKF